MLINGVQCRECTRNVIFSNTPSILEFVDVLDRIALTKE